MKQPCKFCNKEYEAERQSLLQHDLRCKLNPNRVVIKPFTKESHAKSVISKTKINPQDCKFCGETWKNKNAVKQHERFCKLNPEPHKRLSQTSSRAKLTHPCRFCNEKFKKGDLRKHEIWCEKNPNLDYVKEWHASGKTVPNQYVIAKMLGLPKPVISSETRKKLSIAGKNQIWTEEQKLNQSKRMKQAVLDNPSSYSKSTRGRVKHVKKYGLTFDGSWELEFYEFCISNDICVEMNKKFFEYTFDKERLYNPDFYLPKLDLYVEVKGFYDKRDISKWTCFTEKLYIFDKLELELSKKGLLSISNFKDNRDRFIN